MKKKDDKQTIEDFTHNSKTAKSEPGWGNVSKTKLPPVCFATKGKNRSDLKFPHHFIKDGEVGDDGVYKSGTCYLHLGGLRSALQHAGGARSGQKASSAIVAHLKRHANAVGMGEDDK